jgi:hypothetical protein
VGVGVGVGSGVGVGVGVGVEVEVEVEVELMITSVLVEEMALVDVTVEEGDGVELDAELLGCTVLETT